MSNYRPLLLDVVELEKENTILSAELAEVKEQLTQERARLDWLNKQDGMTISYDQWLAENGFGWGIETYGDDKLIGFNKDIRVAIDAAIESNDEK